jgi:hypothetical protein
VKRYLAFALPRDEYCEVSHVDAMGRGQAGVS